MAERWMRMKLGGSWASRRSRRAACSRLRPPPAQLGVVVGAQDGDDVLQRRQLDALAGGDGQAVRAAGGAGEGGLAVAVLAAQPDTSATSSDSVRPAARTKNDTSSSQ
jgi:hypothetical protein